MNERLLSLACALALCPACFAPSADEFAESGDEGVGAGGLDSDTETADDEPIDDGSSSSGGDDSDDAPADDNPDETTGGTGGNDEPIDDDVGETTGEDPTGDEHLVEDDSGGSTGELFLDPSCMSPIELGFTEELGNIGGISGFLYGFPVEVEADGYLTHFGFVAAGDGAGIQMALYSDLNGTPYQVVAESEMLPSYAAGPYELATDEIELPAGTYWLVATLGYPRRISADLNGGQVNFPVSGITHEFGDPLPQIMEDPTAFVNFRPAFFVGVLQ